MPFAFESLRVYQQSVDLADRICTLGRDLPPSYRFLADQLSRAAVSIPANIAEGSGRLTRPARRNFYGISRASLHECELLLEIVARQGLLRRAEHASFKKSLEDIARMLSGLIGLSKKRRLADPP
jgi:four helix bundle protein